MTMNYRNFSLSAMGLAAAGILTLAPAFAQDPARPGVGLPPKAVSNSTAIPTCLEQLKLTPQQQEQVKEVVRNYDEDMVSVWKQFGDRYLETIRTEVLLLTAIEDNLTEPQRKQVRAQRRQTAQHQKALAATGAKLNQATTQAPSAVEQEISLSGITLTAEQEAAADKLQEKYLSNLRSLNRDIQGLHTRLVSLEADKLVEIESVLTKEQLAQLREIRQNAPVVAKVAGSPTSPAK